MGYGNKTLSGLLLFVGAVIYLMGTIIGGKFGNIQLYNASIVALGILMLISVYFIHKAFKSMLLTPLIALAGIGTIGVGILTYASTEYYIFAGIGYVTFALAAIVSYKFEKSPLSYLSVILGISTVLALVLWAANVDLGSGIKVTPLIMDMLLLLWLTGFGAHIIGQSP
jgi:hypothetical protein